MTRIYKLTPEQAKEALVLFNQGITKQDPLARAIGVSKQSVANWLKSQRIGVRAPLSLYKQAAYALREREYISLKEAYYRLRKEPEWFGKRIAYDKRTDAGKSLRNEVHLPMYKRYCVFKRSSLYTMEGYRWKEARDNVRSTARKQLPEDRIEVDLLHMYEDNFTKKYALYCYEDEESYDEQFGEGIWYH